MSEILATPGGLTILILLALGLWRIGGRRWFSSNPRRYRDKHPGGQP